MRKLQWLAIVIILLSFIISIFISPRMPDRMATHWNIVGEADGYSSKTWGLFLMPVLLTGLFLLLTLLPMIDPLKNNVKKFELHYDRFIIVILLFLLYLHTLVVVWNLGIRFNMVQILAPAFAVLFYYLGVLMENTKRNWFIGIRTPWTLASDRVWERTHSLGGRLFKTAGAILLLGLIIPRYLLLLILGLIIPFVIFVLLYSYVVHKKLEK